MSVLTHGMASAQACADSPPAAFLSLLSSVITGHFLTDCDTCRCRGDIISIVFSQVPLKFFLPTQEFLAELRPSPASKTRNLNSGGCRGHVSSNTPRLSVSVLI